MENEILFKPNTLIRGVFEVDSKEYKAFNLMLQKMQLELQRGKDINKDTEIARISVNEFREIFKRNNEKSLEVIKSILDRLQNVKINFIDKNGIPTTAVLIPKVKIYKDEKELGFFMDKEVIEVFQQHLEGKKEFSPLNLTLMKKAKGFYSQRLYELLRSWSGEKRALIMSLKTLKEKLGITDRKSYDEYKNLNKAVLKPAIEEINKKFNMEVTYTAIKSGNRTTKVLFKINDLEPRRYDFKSGSFNEGTDLKAKEPEILAEIPMGYEPEMIQIRLLSYGVRISVNTLKLKQEEYGEELFISAVKTLEDRVQDEQQDKLKAPVRYLVGILNNLKNKSNQAAAPQIQQPNKKSNFANFTQREYDFDKLEKQLLGWDDGEDEDDE